MSITLADIEAARRVIRGAVLRTPMLPAPRLSALTGAEVYVKYENLQVTNSFKDRGALNKLAALSEAERARGVIAMSAGNHAQAVAYHAARLGIPATIVMPVTTPFVKVAATRAHGAEVVLHGETVADAQTRVEEPVRERALVLVHPYDDARIIAGQGTIALEMLEEVGDLDVPGDPDRRRWADLRQRHRRARVKPAIEIVGVEAALYPSMMNALHGGGREAGGPTLAEGIAVKQVSGLTVDNRARAGRRHPAGGRAASGARGERLCHVAKDRGGRRRRRRAGGAAGQSRALPRQDGRPHPVGRQYRSAHPCFHHRARIGARQPHRLVPSEPAGPAGRARPDRHASSARSTPISWRSITTGYSSTCRPRAPSSTSRWRRATPPMPTRSSRPWPPTAISRSASRLPRPWSEPRERMFRLAPAAAEASRRRPRAKKNCPARASSFHFAARRAKFRLRCGCATMKISSAEWSGLPEGGCFARAPLQHRAGVEPRK